MKWQEFCGFPLVMYNYSVPRKAVKPSRKSKLLLKRRVWRSVLTFGMRKVDKYRMRLYTVTSTIFA